MKAISLWQPWASLWLSSRKIHETRHWRTQNRGWIAVHAAKRLPKDLDDELREILYDEFGGHWGMDLPTGSLVGAVDLVGCYSTNTHKAASEDDLECGNWAENRYAWARGKFRVFRRPIPYRGQQGFFEVSPDVFDGAGIDDLLPMNRARSLFDVATARPALDPQGREG